MKIGLVSDTHGFFPTEIYTYFKEVDEIWHAGDIGPISLIDRFNEFKPSRFVYGNIDDGKVRQACPEYIFQEIDGIKLLMIHIAGKDPNYTKQTGSLIKAHRPSVLICGHSHILKVFRDQTNNLLYINPGAAGKVGFHKKRSLISFEIANGKLENLEAIDLGPRAIKKQA